MSRLPRLCISSVLLSGALATGMALAAPPYAELGRAATQAEVAAWDIDVRPDFKGLPAGSGSVDDGMDLFESTCAVCHGIFGESNSIFTPLVGGTSEEDVRTGRTANLARHDYPGSTTFMKAASLSTIWDYINRAMPWDNPKSLSADQVYAVTAYLLNLADIVPPDFVLSDENMAEVQAMMPNRDGMTVQHAMWPGDEFGTADVPPDTSNEACMSDCADEPRITSELPEHARNVWGNLREQNRTVGPQRGSDTTQPEGRLGDAGGPVNIVGPRGSDAGAGHPALALLDTNGCTACHAMDTRLIGPAFQDLATRYEGQAEHMVQSVRAGSEGVWGDVAMPAQEHVSDADLEQIAAWLASGNLD